MSRDEEKSCVDGIAIDLNNGLIYIEKSKV